MQAESTPKETATEFTQRSETHLDSSSPSAQNKSTVKQELTVNGQAIPIPKNRKVQHVIPSPDGNINVTIDNRQRSTSTGSSQSTDVSTEVHITQKGGPESQQ
jgi:hypothetical protein